MAIGRLIASLALAAALPAMAQEVLTPLQVKRDDLQNAIVKDDRRKAAELIRSMEVDFDFWDGLPRTRTAESPLTIAVRRGRPEIVRMLLERGADVNRKDGMGRAALEAAQTPEMVKLLLAAGAKADAPVVAGLTQQLWGAIERNEAQAVRPLIQRGADPNAEINGGRMLHRALFQGKWEIAEALLDGGAQVVIPDRPGCERRGSCESIQAALLASFNPPLLAKLKSLGLDLDTVSATGHTALTSLVVAQPMTIRVVSEGQAVGVARSAASGETVVTQTPSLRPGGVRDLPPPDNAARVQALLDAGADPNRKFRKLTPLMLVLGTHNRPPAMADALIAAGGRIEHDATMPPPPRIPRSEIRPSVVRMDVAAVMVNADNPILGADHRGTLTDMRVGPLAWAVMVGRSDIAARLLERDRRIDKSDRNLVYFAADKGSWELVLAAMRHKAEVNVANRAGVTPLMLAANAGRADVVRVMLAAGADVGARSARIWPPLLERNIVDEFGAAIGGHSPPPPRLVGGYTALQAAQERGHTEVVRILRDAGAS